MRYISIILILLISSVTVKGATPASAVAEEYKFCFQVYDDLVRAIGRLEPTQPKLVIKSDPNVIAEMKSNKEIHIGKKFLDLCRSMNADSMNALALVLGHELAHYYSNHFWALEYGSAYANTDWGNKINEAFSTMHQEMGVYESQADDFGLFFSYVAGYNTLGIATDLYDNIYTTYNLQSDLPGYPSLEERKKIALQSEERIKKLIPIFEAGNLLSILSNVEAGEKRTFMLKEAVSCFEHIINEKFYSREMYNNLGANYIILALDRIGKDMKYSLPVMLDDESRLYDISASRGKGGLGFGSSDPLINEYLSKAEKYLNFAKELDESYIPPFINLACVRILQNKNKHAVLEAEEGYDLSIAAGNNPLAAAALDAWGVALALQDKKEEAIAKLSNAAKQGSKFSENNIHIVKGEAPILAAGNKKVVLFTEEEMIDGKTLREVMSNYNSASAFDLVTTLASENATILSKDEIDKDIYVVICQEGDCPYVNISFYKIKDGNNKTTKNLKLNASSKELTKLYGDPEKIVSTTTGSYYIYSDRKILFKLSNNNKVVNWVNYYIN